MYNWLMNVKECSEMFASFRTLLRKYNEFVTEYVAEYELSPNEIAVLSGLHNITTASAIARDADVSKALVSRSVKSLKEKGLIEVSISAIDKREQDLQLTENGLAVSDLIDEANDRFCTVAFKDTDKKALEITGLMLEIIIKNLNGKGD